MNRGDQSGRNMTEGPGNESGTCPICGDEYEDRHVFRPEEGPNKSPHRVEGFYHDKFKMCTRKLDECKEAA